MNSTSNLEQARRRLLLVDDDRVFTDVLAAALRRRAFEIAIAHDLHGARQKILEHQPEAAVIDLRIGQESGLALVEELARQRPACRIVVLTGFGSIATAVEAIKLGATQYLSKPADVEEILAALAGRAPRREADETGGPPSVRRLEWEHIQRVLTENNGNVSATARALGMHRRTLQRKLQKRPVRG